MLIACVKHCNYQSPLYNYKSRLMLRQASILIPRVAAPISLVKTAQQVPALRKTTMTTQATAGDAPTDDVKLQYVILRRDLWTEMGWPLGSIVAQACHASTAALWLSRDEPTTQDYCSPDNLDHMHKVVLEAKDEKQLLQLAEKMNEAGVRHKLWVEQPENFPTCLATAPYPKSQVAPLVKKLKLCKGN